MFKALKEKNYRLFFSGQFISLLGSWIANTAMSWLIYRLTGSASIMGIVTFINALPSLILMPIAGVVIDKINQYKMMIFLQAMLMLWAVMLAFLTITNMIEVWHIIVLGLFANIVLAFDMPLRQAFVVKLVKNKELMNNAISLNSLNFNTARLIGPAISGILIAKFSEGICFLLNAISFIAVIIALLFINMDEKQEKKEIKLNIAKDLKEGFLYVKKHKLIRLILLFLSCASFIGGTYSLIMPVFVKEFLNNDPKYLGYLMSATGVGTVLGSLFVASLKDNKNKTIIMVLGNLFFGISTFCLAFIHIIYFDFVLMFIIGFAMTSAVISSNNTIQSVVEDSKRGRVMSFYTLSFMASIPLGNLCIGYIIEQIGLSSSLVLCGLLMMSCSAYFGYKFKKL
ncbi:MAG: MFS transporter [Alphaproteobacteria bacterium]